MTEKTYKVMGLAGGANIAIGIISIVIGVTTGIILRQRWKAAWCEKGTDILGRAL